jgi:hypothetical protein
VRFVADKVAVEEIFLRILRFSPVSNISPMLHIHLHLHVTLARSTNGRSLGTFQKAMLYRQSESIGQKNTFTLYIYIYICRYICIYDMCKSVCRGLKML